MSDLRGSPLTWPLPAVLLLGGSGVAQLAAVSPDLLGIVAGWLVALVWCGVRLRDFRGPAWFAWCSGLLLAPLISVAVLAAAIAVELLLLAWLTQARRPPRR